MKFLISIFLASLVLGQLGGIQLSPGITIFFHDLLAVGIILISSFQYLTKKKEIQGSLIKPLSYFIGIAVVSLLLNVGKFSYSQLLLGSLYLWRFMLYAGLYLVARNEKISSMFWIVGLYCVGVSVAILGFVQYIFYPSLRNLLYQGWDEHYYRLFSTFLDPNFVGMFFVFSFFIGLFLYNKRWQIQISIGQIIIGVALILTYSRSSFLAFLAGILVFVILTRKKVLLLSIIFGGLIYAGLPNHGIDANRLFRSESASARISSYRESLILVQQSPIIGIGFNMLRYQATRQRMLDADGIVSRDAGGLNSSLLVVLVTTGIIGLSIFGYLVYKMAVVMYQRNDMVGYIGLSLMAALGVHSLFNNSIFYSWILIGIFIFWGSSETIKKIKK